MMEDKREIVRSLCETLQQTREFRSDLAKMIYLGPNTMTDRPHDEVVLIIRNNEMPKRVNVTGDSGIALIRDVLRGLEVI